jgi:DNA replication protein DnaC
MIKAIKKVKKVDNLGCQIMRIMKETKKNGNSNTKPKYNCEICKDSGWINNNGLYRPCGCIEAQTYKKRLEQSGISREFQKRNFENFITLGNQELENIKIDAINYVTNFNEIVEDENNSIALVGRVGSGKTHIAMAIANGLIKNGHGVLYASYPDEILALKQTMMKNEEYEKRINQLKRAKILLVDDLFKALRDKDDSINYQIFNFRYLNKLPCIITTEKRPEKWLDFDEAIGSRIFEMCKGRILIFGDDLKNYRLKNKNL